MGLTAKIASVALLVIIAASLLSPIIVPYEPDTIDLSSLRLPPSSNHLLGTDNKGRDVLARLLYGGRISIGISFAAASISMLIGLFVGLVSGYFRGRTDTVLMAAADLVLSFPALLLAVGVSVIFPPGIYSVMIALSAVGWASFARLIRGNTLSLRESPCIDAARAIGCSDTRIIFVHILPQCLPFVLVMAGLRIGGYILSEAALSFLGLGAQPPTATWGSMVSANRVFINSAPWMVFAPGLMIAVTALCFNLAGDGLREKYDLENTSRKV